MTLAELTLPEIRGTTQPPHLLLPQDDNSSRFDGVPGSQVVPSAQLLPVLVSFPLTVPCGPGDADVVPPPIAHEEGQLGYLESKHGLLLNSHILNGQI